MGDSISAGMITKMEVLLADAGLLVQPGILTAALANCQVRVEEGLRLIWTATGEDAPDDHFDGNQPGWARTAVAYHLAEIEKNQGWQVVPFLLRRLIITTPAEVVTDE